MIWILYIVGSLVGLVALLWVVGLFMPKGHVVTRSLRLEAPPEEVWAVMTSYEDQSWRSGWTKAERLPDREGKAVWKETVKGEAMTLQTDVSEPSTRLVRTMVDTGPFGGSWTYELSPAGAGTEITITERGEIYAPPFRVISRFMDMSKTVETYLGDLGKKLER